MRAEDHTKEQCYPYSFQEKTASAGPTAVSLVVQHFLESASITGDSCYSHLIYLIIIYIDD